jgi:hypothetical protein
MIRHSSVLVGPPSGPSEEIDTAAGKIWRSSGAQFWARAGSVLVMAEESEP